MFEVTAQAIKEDRIESLRLILEQEQRRTFTHDETREVADSLIRFFEILADSDNDAGKELTVEPWTPNPMQ